MADLGNFPFDSLYYQREKAKIESELQKRLSLAIIMWHFMRKREV